VEILLCRGSAKKIASPVRWRSGGTDSGKKLLKNSIIKTYSTSNPDDLTRKRTAIKIKPLILLFHSRYKAAANWNGNEI